MFTDKLNRLLPLLEDAISKARRVASDLRDSPSPDTKHPDAKDEESKAPTGVAEQLLEAAQKLDEKLSELRLIRAHGGGSAELPNRVSDTPGEPSEPPARVQATDRPLSPEHQRLITACGEVSTQALAEVDRDWGCGYPNWTPGQERTLTYHNGLHARDVQTWGGELAAVCGLDPVDVAVAQAAGAAHDRFQGPGHEERNAQWFKETLSRHGFPSDKIDIGMEAIRGTRVHFDTGQLVQVVTEMDFSSNTAAMIARGVASADLGVIHQPAAPFRAHQLFLEFQSKTHGDVLDMSKMAPMQQNQIALAEQFSYPLPEADSHLSTHKRQVIRHYEKQLQLIEKDAVTWDQILADDLDFMRQHS